MVRRITEFVVLTGKRIKLTGWTGNFHKAKGQFYKKAASRPLKSLGFTNAIRQWRKESLLPELEITAFLQQIVTFLLHLVEGYDKLLSTQKRKSYAHTGWPQNAMAFFHGSFDP